MENILSKKQVNDFRDEGYLIVPEFFDQSLIEKIHRVAVKDQVISKNSFDLDDQSGRKTRLALWYNLGDDIYSRLTKWRKMVDAANLLLDEQGLICHFQSKLMQKEPEVGGAWEWHQDYGYWYKHGFLYPNQMLSAMIAITEANKENGCLQVIKGSHKIGRVDHGITGEQTGADSKFVEFALKNHKLEFVDLKPGDVVFFHSNILHKSEANLSQKSRWSLISVYNRQSNDALIDHYPSATNPVEVIPEIPISSINELNLLQENSVDFLRKDKIS
ncbi:MAG: phytanoyl-CoA dioxygenase family protein [Cyclobacteriaceae bacterium]